MTEDNLAIFKLLGGASFGVALLYVVYLIGTRMIASNDRNTERWSTTIEKLGDKVDATVTRLGDRVDQHKVADLASHSDLQSSVTGLHSKIDGMMDAFERVTTYQLPIEEQSRNLIRLTPPAGVPISDSERSRAIASGTSAPYRRPTKGER